MLTSFVSLILLFTAIPCLAILRCQAPLTTSGQTTHAPDPDDCRRALDHIPILGEDFGEGSFNPLRLLDPSSPFLPQAQLHHNSCVISMGYFEDMVHESFSEVLTLFPALPDGHAHEASVYEESVFWMWTILRATGESIVGSCVDHGQTGIDWGPLHVPMLPFAWYVVKVLAVDQRSMGSHALEGGQRVALRFGGTSQLIPTGMNDKFKTTFQDV